MDGLLINTEDLVTDGVSAVLKDHGKDALTPKYRAELIGVPHSTADTKFYDTIGLPSEQREKFARELEQKMDRYFTDCKPLRGAHDLLSRLNHASASSGDKIELALATTSWRELYDVKTSKPEIKDLLDLIPSDKKVLGDDPRVKEGRTKPAPDLYNFALESLNSSADSGVGDIQPSECLVFEDSIPGVKAGRRAGMRVVWVQNPTLVDAYQEMLKDMPPKGGIFPDVGEDWELEQINDGWTEIIPSLEEFDYKKYGIVVSSQLS